MLKKYNRAEVRKLARRLKNQQPYRVPNSSVLNTINILKLKAGKRQLGDYDPLYSVIDKYADPVEVHQLTMGGWDSSKNLLIVAGLIGVFLVLAK